MGHMWGPNVGAQMLRSICRAPHVRIHMLKPRCKDLYANTQMSGSSYLACRRTFWISFWMPLGLIQTTGPEL